MNLPRCNLIFRNISRKLIDQVIWEQYWWRVRRYATFFRPTRNILHYLAEWVYDTNYECLALEIVGELYPASTYFRRQLQVFVAVASPFNFTFLLPPDFTDTRKLCSSFFSSLTLFPLFIPTILNFWVSLPTKQDCLNQSDSRSQRLRRTVFSLAL